VLKQEISTQLYLVDRFIRDYSGHYFNYAMSIYRAAISSGLHVKCLGSRECLPEVERSMRIERTFSPYHSPKTRYFIPRKAMVLYRMFRWNFSFFRDLVKKTKFDVNRNSVVFFPDIDNESLLSIPFWLQRFSPSNAPTLVLMLRMSLWNQDGKMLTIHAFVWRMALLQFKFLSRKYKICLVSDSSRIAEQFTRITRLPVAIVPIPHTSDIGNGQKQNAVKQISDKNDIHFVTLGGARVDKGFAVIVKAIQLLDAKDCLDNITFILQIHQAANVQEIEQSIQILKKMNLQNVKLIEKPLDTDEYYEHLMMADVVLFPYKRKIYHSNTSGPFVEALAAGKPVVVTKGTWMDEQLSRFGAGVTFQDEDVDGLAKAICSARDEYSCLAERAIDLSEQWIAYHNPENFLKELLRVAS